MCVRECARHIVGGEGNEAVNGWVKRDKGKEGSYMMTQLFDFLALPARRFGLTAGVNGVSRDSTERLELGNGAGG